MSSIKPSSRYAKTSLDSSRSSTKSDPSSSTDTCLIKIKKGSNGVGQTTHQSNFTSMVKKFVEHKSSSSKFLKKEKKGDLKLVIPVDFIAEDLKKTAAKRGGGLSGLHKKLFKGSTFSAGGGVKKEEGSGNKALTEVKGNTRTLGMVLRSERDLLSMNKEQEDQIVELKLMLEEKNREVEKLKDLCLKQREEIKSLKYSILFPDVMNSQVQDHFEKQGSELRQAKQLIPNLQRQVTSLTGQLQCLAEDLAEEAKENGFHDLSEIGRGGVDECWLLVIYFLLLYLLWRVVSSLIGTYIVKSDQGYSSPKVWPSGQ